MQVETYEIQELTTNGEIENPEDTKALVESLGLTGQQQFFNGNSGSVAVFPYRKITANERLVYKTICSKECKLEDYSDAMIPLRVLQVAAHAKAFELESSGVFLGHLEVWYCPNGDVKDPVLVGVKNTKNSWGGTDSAYYLLARWGEVLESFSDLSKIALQMLKDKAKAEFSVALMDLQSKETSIELLVTKKFNEGSSLYISSSCH